MSEENTTDTSNRYALSGRITDHATGYGVGGIRIEAWDEEGLCRDLVAHTVTDSLGDFRITLDDSHLDQLFLDRRPALSFRLFLGNERYPDPSVTWQPSIEPKRIRIAIDSNAIRTAQAPLLPSCAADSPSRTARRSRAAR